MASNILQQITRDDHLRSAIFSREKAENDRQAREVHSRKMGREEGLNEGLQKGRQEGIEEAMAEIARRLETLGTSLSDISKITNLSIDQLKILLNR